MPPVQATVFMGRRATKSIGEGSEPLEAEGVGLGWPEGFRVRTAYRAYECIFLPFGACQGALACGSCSFMRAVDTAPRLVTIGKQ
jgi:hypothetical protein